MCLYQTCDELFEEGLSSRLKGTTHNTCCLRQEACFCAQERSSACERVSEYRPWLVPNLLVIVGDEGNVLHLPHWEGLQRDSRQGLLPRGHGGALGQLWQYTSLVHMVFLDSVPKGGVEVWCRACRAILFFVVQERYFPEE